MVYSFTLENINQFKNREGIYFLIYEDYPIYIGQSTNIANRLKTHKNPKALQNIIKTIIKNIEKNGKSPNYNKTIAMYNFINEHRDSIQFAVLETNELDKWEEYYINEYKPKYNYKGVDIPYNGK